MLGNILTRVQSIVQVGLESVAQLVSRWNKPCCTSHPLSTVADLARSKPQLIAENLLLRQHIVLNRAVKRPRFSQRDRAFVILLANRLQTWKDALFIIKPETVLRWHRQGFRMFWKRKSHAQMSLAWFRMKVAHVWPDRRGGCV